MKSEKFSIKNIFYRSLKILITGILYLGLGLIICMIKIRSFFDNCTKRNSIENKEIENLVKNKRKI